MNQFFQLHSSYDKVQSSLTSSSLKEQTKDHHTNLMAYQKSKLIFENENLSSLHAKLYREADKIRKWKTQTELELHEKEKKLHEASMHIENMKKTVLEFQLKNQWSSSKLQEEAKSKEEVLEKVNSTRELCGLLKINASKLEEKLLHFEFLKSELCNLERENKENIEILKKKFENLQRTAEDTKKKLQNQVDKIKQDSDLREKQISQQLKKNEHQRQLLKDQINDADSKIHQLRISIAEKDIKLQDLLSSIETLKVKVSDLSEQLKNSEKELRNSSIRISEMQEDKRNQEISMKELENKLHSLQLSKDSLYVEMNDSIAKLEKSITESHEHLQISEEALKDKQKQLDICEEKLGETLCTLENFKKSHDAFLIEKMNTEMQLDILEFQLSNMKEIKRENNEEINRLNGEISVLTSKLDKEYLCKSKIQDENDALQFKISALLLEQDEQLEKIVTFTNEQKLSQEKVSYLERVLAEKENTLNNAECTSDTLNQIISEKSLQIQNLESNFLECKKNLQNAKQELCEKNQTISDFTTIIQALKQENSKQENDLKSFSVRADLLEIKQLEYTSEIQSLKSLVKELSEKTIENEKSLTSQHSKIITLIKLNKDLEKEVKSARNKIEVEEKNNDMYEKKRNRLQQDLKMTLEKKDAAEKLNIKYKADLEAANILLKKVEEKLETAVKEKEIAIVKTERQMSAMMATLDDYMQNNQAIIVDKDREIQTLRTKLQKIEIVAQESEKALLEWKQEIERNKVDTLTKNKKSGIQVDFRNNNNDSDKTSHTKIKKNVAHEDLEKVNSVSTHFNDVVKTPLMHLNPDVENQKTPQHGILKPSNHITKRRKVAFTPKDSTLSDDSDVVELDIHAFKALKTPTRPKYFPRDTLNTSHLLLRTPQRSTLNNDKSPMDAQIGKKDIGHKKSEFDSISSLKIHGKSSEIEALDDSKLNVRKTPLRKSSKFFTSPKNKSAVCKSNQNKKANKDNTEHLAWFELDSVYGFVSED